MNIRVISKMGADDVWFHDRSNAGASVAQTTCGKAADMQKNKNNNKIRINKN